MWSFVAVVLGLLSLLPLYLRPGVLLLAIICLAYLLFYRSGVRTIARTLVQCLARSIDWLVGLALLPGYLIARQRRRDGREPLTILSGGNLFETVLDGAASLFETAQRWVGRKRPWPTGPLVVLTILCSSPWAASLALAPSDGAMEKVNQAFVSWQGVECWAEVPSSFKLLRTRPVGRRHAVRLRAELGTDNASSVVTLSLSARRGWRHPGRLAIRLNEDGIGSVKVPRSLRRLFRPGKLVDVMRGKVVVAQLLVGRPSTSRCVASE
jgi:hypothetical protein